MRALIIGCGGHIGSLLTQMMQDAGWQVTGFDNLMFGQGPLVYPTLKKIKFYKEDVTTWPTSLLDAVYEADVIFPLAAYVGAPLCDRHPYKAKRINEDFVVWLMRYLRPEQKIIFPNTNSGYGTTPQGEVSTEDTPLNPISLYGKAKAAAEQAVLQHPNSYVFRLATLYGMSPRPRLDLLVNNLVFRAEKEGRLDIFQPAARRNYVHVRDVCKVFKYVAECSDVPTGVYNLGNDEANCTKLELATKIADHFNILVGIDNSKIDSDKRDYVVSSAKLRKVLPESLKFTSLEQGIEEMAQVIPFFDLECSMTRNY